jgi:hypothetical protein
MELAEALHAVGDGKVSYGRGKGHQSVPEHGKLNHKDIGLAPNWSARGTYLKGVQGLDKHWLDIKRFLAQVENVAMEYIEGPVLRGLQAAKRFERWPSLRQDNLSIWAGLSAGHNVYLQVHTDHDFFLSMTLVVPASGELKLEDDDKDTHFFCFPKQGRSVAMKPTTTTTSTTTLTLTLYLFLTLISLFPHATLSKNVKLRPCLLSKLYEHVDLLISKRILIHGRVLRLACVVLASTSIHFGHLDLLIR